MGEILAFHEVLGIATSLCRKNNVLIVNRLFTSLCLHLLKSDVSFFGYSVELFGSTVFSCYKLIVRITLEYFLVMSLLVNSYLLTTTYNYCRYLGSFVGLFVELK